MQLLWVAVGGAAGSVARYLMGAVVQRATSTGFPVGTLAVNVLGCALAGFLGGSLLTAAGSQSLRALAIIGFCGGFTTFSAFSLEAVGLMQGGEWGKAGLYVLLSVAASLAGAAAGFAVGRPSA